MAGITKEEIFASNLEEEASVLEIYNQLLRRIGDEDPAALQNWLKAELIAAARAERIGFYIDEFGARDVREIESEEAIALLELAQIWSVESDTMLHAYLMEDEGNA
ncbi:MAG: hypothetical protein WBJ75_01860 [Pseudohongiellaceae bacterium]|nr:MAG: hypothetical protein A3H44_11645 [Gammaproteobacteria bacterium RIFCSPLOWO2_02_FULL_57_10]